MLEESDNLINLVVISLSYVIKSSSFAHATIVLML